MIVNLLEFYRGYFHSIIIFSPTVHNDEKWDFVKRRAYLRENLPLKDWIKAQEKQKAQKGLVERPSRSSEFDGIVKDREPAFDGIIPEECFFEDYSETDLTKILDEQNMVIKLLKKHGKTKYLANRILFIFDDLVGSVLFGGQRENPFKIFGYKVEKPERYTNNTKEIPKTVRTGWSALILFEISNDKELEVIFEEFSMGMNKKQWAEAYGHCVEEDYGFIYFNFQKEKRLRVMKKFESVLFFAPEPVESKMSGGSGGSIKMTDHNEPPKKKAKK